MKNERKYGRRAPGGKIAGFLPLVMLVIVLGLAACSADQLPRLVIRVEADS